MTDLGWIAINNFTIVAEVAAGQPGTRGHPQAAVTDFQHFANPCSIGKIGVESDTRNI